MIDTSDSHIRDTDIVVLNKYTGNFVDFRLSPIGEIVLISPNEVDSELSCIVTTWGNIYNKNLEKGKSK
jgi:hypothetical protein